PASVAKASRPAISGTNSVSYPVCSAVRTICTRSCHESGSRTATPTRCVFAISSAIVARVPPVRFETSDGVSLEGELRMPDGEPRGTALICHPYPRAGGSKDHPLLWAIRNELRHRGFVVLSFNFRGVMGSSGEQTDGEKEPLDARAAIDRVRQEAAGPTFAAAWSFGANVALREAV